MAPSLSIGPEFLDAAHHYNFTQITDTGAVFSRGGIEYIRSCSWNRLAFRVTGKFGSETWLGQTNAADEWPVLYHGTGLHNIKSIVQEGFKIAQGRRFSFGLGNYTTPNIQTAEKFVTEFTCHGQRYKVVHQNRVNPANLKEVNGGYWISPGDNDVRPYGICIKKL